MGTKIASDKLSWLNLRLGEIATSDLRRQKTTARAILRRLYGEDAAPGVILADEVGMGKTYVALAVAAALFANYGAEKKIVVLAPGRQMKYVWMQRWQALREKQRGIDLPEGKDIAEMKEAREGISFGSYDRMKHTTGREILAAFNQACSGHGRPHRRVRRRLCRELFEAYGIGVPKVPAELKPLPQGQLDRFWRKNYKSSDHAWSHPWAAYTDLQQVVLRSRRPRSSPVDLLIFDEAHRLGGSQRQLFFREVVYSKTKRTLFVSATPFSLRVEELLDRIRDLYLAAGKDADKVGHLADLLTTFRDVVKARSEISADLKAELEDKLGRFLIRNMWPESWPDGHDRRNFLQSLNVPSEYLVSRDQAYATFAMEKEFAKLESSGRKLHIAVDRETLCSSYGAIKVANERRRRPFDDVVRYLPNNGKESPKLEFAVSKLPELIAGAEGIPEKVVVFCNRNETIRELRRRMEKRFRPLEKAAARRWTNTRKSLLRRGRDVDWPKARLASYLYDDFSAKEVAKFTARLEKLIGEAPPEVDYWKESWGPRRRIEWVSTLTGEQGGEERPDERPNEHVQFAFNLPGPPYILICSQVAKESIDLHRWCRKVVHYDHAWNPAVMEQRVGRIDRINSLAMRRRLPIEIYYFAVKGTYEERIFNVVRERMEMMRVLLGAGEWLAEVGQPREEFGGILEKYRLSFVPRAREA